MKKPFENVDRKLSCDFWQMSQNDLDLQNFIMVEFESTTVSKSTTEPKKMHFLNFVQSKA